MAFLPSAALSSATEAKPVPGRRYEVSILREKRWIIDCLMAQETEARARADALYADETLDAVRVTRGRFGPDGTLYETKILEQVRRGRRGDAPVRVAAAPAEEAWCDTLEDFYGAASRRAIARVLRNFLDRHAITPTELLHHHRYIRLLDRQDNLQQQAIQRMVALQSRARGVSARQRLDEISTFVDQAINKARDALASRSAPRLGPEGLVALGEAISQRVKAPAEEGFYLRFAVSRAFEEISDPAAKLDRVLQWTATPLPPSFAPLVDELVSGLLGGASLLQDMLGPQPHLGAALETLTDLVLAHPVEMKSVPPALNGLMPLLGEGDMPETRLVLLDRLQRELATEKPLSRDDMAKQRALFERLVDKLLDSRGVFVGGAPIVEALARRSRRFAIVGGIDVVRFASEEPITRMTRLVELAEGVLSQRQQRVVGTYMMELLERPAADPAAFLPLKGRLVAVELPRETKAALSARLTPGTGL